MRPLEHTDVAGNKTLVNTTSELISSLYQVKDIIKREVKYFEKETNAYEYLYEENLINPNTGRSYKRLLSLSCGCKRRNDTTLCDSEELKNKH